MNIAHPLCIISVFPLVVATALWRLRGISFILAVFFFCLSSGLGQMMASFQKPSASFWPGWKEARSTAATPTTFTPWSSPPMVTSAGWPLRRVSMRRRWKRPRKSSKPLWRASWASVSPRSVSCKQKRICVHWAMITNTHTHTHTHYNVY